MLDWRDPAVKRVFKLMVPVTLGLGLINVNAVIDTFFASRFIDPSLAPTAIQKAFLVYMLPQGMFSVAIATVLFPTLSRLAAARRPGRRSRDTVSTGVRQIAFLLVPAAVVSAVLAEPIIRLLYQRGHWTPAQTPVVAGALAAFSAGLVFNGFDADAEPCVLQPAVELDPDVRRARQPRLERDPRRRLLPVRRLGDPARDRNLQRRRHGRARRPAAAAARPVRRRRDGRGPLEDLRRLGADRGRSRTRSGGRSTRLSAARSRRQIVSLGLALAVAVGVYLAACRALRVRELQALLSLRSRLSRG